MKLAAAALATLLLISTCANAQTDSDFWDRHQWYLDNYPSVPPDTLYTLESELAIPDGYARPDSATLSDWSFWISHFPLWHRFKPVADWKSKRVAEPNEISRVLYFPDRGRHLNPAAIPLRLLGEYFLQRGRTNDMLIIPRAGERITFEKWLNGQYAFNALGEVIFKKSEERTATHGEYISMLKRSMEMTNCASLADNCVAIPESEVKPGDLYLSWDNESQDAVVLIIMYMLVRDNGDRLFAVATGCAEPCEPHIPYFTHDRNDPWLTVDEIPREVPVHENRGFFRFRLVDNR